MQRMCEQMNPGRVKVSRVCQDRKRIPVAATGTPATRPGCAKRGARGIAAVGERFGGRGGSGLTILKSFAVVGGRLAMGEGGLATTSPTYCGGD